MKTNILLSLILAGSLISVAHADEAAQTSNTSTVKASDVQKKDETQKDIDDEITNARMRATLGSKSKWSFKSALGYSGGSIQKPFDGVIPAYRAGGSRETLAAISGTVGINYRLTENDNLGLNTGLTVIDPLHGNIVKPAQDKRYGCTDCVANRYQVSTPTVSWSRGYKALGAQQITEVDLSYYTDSDSHDSNDIGAISLNQTVLADLGNSNWQAGVSAMYDQEFYGGGIKTTDPDTIAYFERGYSRPDMILALYPFAEYQFNDTYSFRTVFGYFEFYHYKNEYGNSQKFMQKEPYQSVGVGISITRDIYIYPNFQFTPKDIRADRTNVALSTNISLF